MRFPLVVLLATLLGTTGCGSSITEPTSDELSVSGTWRGFIGRGPNPPAPSLVFTLVQRGDTITGVVRTPFGFVCVPELPVCEGQAIVTGVARLPEVYLRLEHTGGDELRLRLTERGQHLDGSLQGASTGPSIAWSVTLRRVGGS